MIEFTKKHFWKITSLVLALLLLLKCDSNSINSNYAIIPEKKGSFEINKPTEIKNRIIYKYKTLKGDTIELENPINLELAKLYQLEKDSLKRELLYYKSIQKRTYSDTVKDKNIKMFYTAKTTGTLDYIKLEYITPKDSIKIKKPVFTLLGGLTLESNITNPKPTLKANLGFKTSNKDTWLFGANKNEASVTYLRDIFTIKK